jgi:hypothetical protein
MNRRFQLVMLLMSMVGVTTAQQTESQSHLTGPDRRSRFNGLSHVEVDLGRKNALIVGFETFSQATGRQNVDSVLRLFVADYRKVADTTQSQTGAGATHVLYRLGSTNRTADVRYMPPLTATFRFANGQPDPMLVKTRQDTLQIVWSSALMPLTYYDFSLYFLVNRLNDLDRILQEGGVNEKLQQAFQAVRQYKHHNLTNPKMAFDLRYRREGESIQTQFISPGLAKRPFIIFHPNVGLGLVRTRWVPSLNIDAAYVPSRFKPISYSVGYLALFNADEGDNRIQRSDFLNVGISFYHNNTSQQKADFSRPRASFSIGMLMNPNNYFAKGAIRLSGTLYQKGFIKIQPELYINGSFKQVYPGVRIGFGL